MEKVIELHNEALTTMQIDVMNIQDGKNGSSDKNNENTSEAIVAEENVTRNEHVAENSEPASYRDAAAATNAQ